LLLLLLLLLPPPPHPPQQQQHVKIYENPHQPAMPRSRRQRLCSISLSVSDLGNWIHAEERRVLRAPTLLYEQLFRRPTAAVSDDNRPVKSSPSRRRDTQRPAVDEVTSGDPWGIAALHVWRRTLNPDRRHHLSKTILS
jgi:hypothetical protein